MVCGPVPCTITVELAGVHALPPEEVFAVMRIFEATEPEAEIWERDAVAVSSLYYDHGYMQVKVAPPGISWSRDGRSARVRFAVEEGPQIRLRRYTAFEQVNGVLADPMGGWRPSLAPGDVFSRRRLVLDLIWLNRIYRDAGYAEVIAHPETDVDAERGEVSVRIPITRGEVHTFGRIRFVGLKKNAEADLRQRIAISEGQRYSETALIQSKKALSAASLFYRVDVSTTKGQGPAQMDVTFEVDERP
jgi:outer membrane protein insertion porin family